MLTFASEDASVPIYQRWVVLDPVMTNDDDEVNLVSVYEVEKEDWQNDLTDYLEHGKLPNDLRNKTEV